jgi:uncharacterized protein YehS (DUF1456 family)
MGKFKNNHFVPQRYLKRFRSLSDKQVGLYNLKSDRIVEGAPMKSQCSRDYFYTKNPVFEREFTKLEANHETLFERIIADEFVPTAGSYDRSTLSAAIMFQEGRTAAAAAHANHLANAVVKSMLRVHLQKEGKKDLLDLLPEVKVTMPNAVLDSVFQHLPMYPLIDDLDCTLFVNRTTEDFLTSDHPVAIGNNLPNDAPSAGSSGFASRGLMIALPLSSRALFFLSDREVYDVTRNGAGVAFLTNSQDVVGLNLAQCFNAQENLYFAASAAVKRTLDAFREGRGARRTPSSLTETPVERGGRKQLLIATERDTQRMSLPAVVAVRRPPKNGKYRAGDAFVRDYLRTLAVRAEADRLHKLREAATKRAKAAEAG